MASNKYTVLIDICYNMKIQQLTDTLAKFSICSQVISKDVIISITKVWWEFFVHWSSLKLMFTSVLVVLHLGNIWSPIQGRFLGTQLRNSSITFQKIDPFYRSKHLCSQTRHSYHERQIMYKDENFKIHIQLTKITFFTTH